MAVVFHAADWIGLERSQHQDRTLALSSRGLFAVVDGFGSGGEKFGLGAPVGEVAAEFACEILSREFEASPVGSDDPGARLTTSLKHANHALWSRSQAEPELRGMGCTVAAVVLDANRVWIAHVGEARVYLAGIDGGERITTDHSLGNDMLREGKVTPAEARTSHLRNILTRTLGSGASVEPELTERRLHRGDRLLLVTDGVWRYAEEDRVMLDLMREADTPRALVEALFAHVERGGADDNLAAVAIEYSE